LVAAVYRNETEQLVAAADRLAKTHPPVTALREWLLLFVDYIATKHGMYELLNSIAGGTSDLYSASTAQVKQAIAKLVDRAVASGDIRLDLDPLDLLRALAGVANIGLGPDGEQAAKRLVDILIAGVRAELARQCRRFNWNPQDAKPGLHTTPSRSLSAPNANPRGAQRVIPPSIVRLEPVM
jgi:hypothetical protein